MSDKSYCPDALIPVQLPYRSRLPKPDNRISGQTAQAFWVDVWVPSTGRPGAVDVNLWMPIEGHLDKIHVVIRNTHEMSQFWLWRALCQDMIPQMKTVLDSGKRVTVTEKPGWVSVLAPVSDRLSDVVGEFEVVTQTQANVGIGYSKDTQGDL